jgi:O-antigen/teichoic acid export membrane protein
MIGRPRRVSLSPGLWRAAARIGTLQGVVAIFTAFDSVVVAALVTTRGAAGPYQAAATLGRIPLFVSVAVSTAVFPVLLASRGSITHRVQAMRTVLVVSALAFVVLLTAPPGVVALFFPADFLPLVLWLPSVAALGVGLGLLNLVTTFVQTEQEMGRPIRRALCGLGIHVVAVTAGGLLYGVAGLVLGAIGGVWLTVVLVSATSTEIPALRALLRALRSPVPLVLIVAFWAALNWIDQPYLWLGVALVGGTVGVVAAFPELAGALPFRRSRRTSSGPDGGAVAAPESTEDPTVPDVPAEQAR